MAHKQKQQQKQQQQITVDLSDLRIGDLVLFDRFKAKEATNTELVKFLDRVVVGGAAHRPLKMLHEIATLVFQEMEQMANPESPEGN